MLVYFDETEIHWCPDIGKNYQPEGEQNRISSPGKDSICYIIGGIVYPTAEGLYEIFHRKRTMEVESYLISLCEMFSDSFIFLVWDNAKTHTTEMLEPFFQAHQEQICPVFLPTYSPHLNLIERLWRQMRANITKDHFFFTLKETCQAVINWLEDFSFQKLMSLLGVDVQQFPQIEYVI